MSKKHPYVPGPGGLAKVILHLRRSFPAKFTSDTVKKLGYAPKNESYVISVLRFLTVIDKDGAPGADAKKAFAHHDDAAFQKAFGDLVALAYSGLFELYGEATWSLEADSLITFFRSTDQTTALVGQRQASTFRQLASLAGHGVVSSVATPQAKQTASRSKAVVPKGDTGAKSRSEVSARPGDSEAKASRLGLTVRIEVNLPADGDQQTYDSIFRSIRKNLLDG